MICIPRINSRNKVFLKNAPKQASAIPFVEFETKLGELGIICGIRTYKIVFVFSILQLSWNLQVVSGIRINLCEIRISF